MSQYTLLTALVLLLCVTEAESCIGGSRRRGSSTSTPTEHPSCARCDNWYTRERGDDGWRRILNQRLRCPCRVRYSWLSTIPVDNPSGANWSADLACNRIVYCFYHPGAYACIRSTDAQGIGNAQQQCCYTRDGNILRPPHRGAGTPDREASNPAHQTADVDPYNWCCKDCANRCDKYLGLNGVRAGDTSHCR